MSLPKDNMKANTNQRTLVVVAAGALALATLQLGCASNAGNQTISLNNQPTTGCLQLHN